MSNLQRMIVIHPELFKKFKHIITEDQNLTELDKKMKAILHNKNLNDINKWYHYRESLLKFSFLKKNKIKLLSPSKLSTMENSTQTNNLVNRHKEIQATHSSQEMSTQTNHISNTKTYSPKSDDKMEIFSNVNDNIDVNEELSNDDFDDDDEIRKLALENQPIGVKILKERKTTKAAANKYRIFELSNGEDVTVPIFKEKMLTRSTALATGKLSSQSPKQLIQSALPFKTVKKPKTVKETKKNTPSSSSPATKKSDLSWTPY